MTRFYSSVAGEKELASGIDNSTQSIPLNNVTGLPNQFPYTLILDHDTASEEIVNVTAAVGTTLTAGRGVDGTVGLAHELGAKVVHAMTARDLQESRNHEDATTDVHGVGVANSVVGTNTVQTLEGKTIDGLANTLQNVPQSATTNLVTDQATQNSRLTVNEGNISSLTTQVTNHVDDNTGVHGVGTVAGLAEAQTLTNKTMSGSDNTFSNIGQGSIQRAVLELEGEGTDFNINNGVERIRNSFNATSNTGGFTPGPNSSEWHVPLTGLYLIQQSGAFVSTSNTEEGVELRMRSGGTGGTTGNLFNRAGGNFAGRNEAFVTQIEIGVLSAGTRVTFSAANVSGVTITDLGNGDWKHAGIIYLGPVG